MDRIMENKMDQMWKKFVDSAPEEVVKTLKKGMNNPVMEALVKNAIQLGDKAPDFKLFNQLGQSVRLYSFLKRGPVVLTWYRGSWCPYCNMHLQYLQRNISIFKELGANLLALSPEKPDNSLNLKEKNELEFQVLTDLDNKVAKDYGIVFKLIDEVSNLYKNTFNLNLEAYNDSGSDELPIPASYVIDQSGIIRYSYVNPDYTQRAEPKDIIEALKSLNN
jgi:peroxiredoxin